MKEPNFLIADLNGIIGLVTNKYPASNSRTSFPHLIPAPHFLPDSKDSSSSSSMSCPTVNRNHHSEFDGIVHDG